jgi:hypothetical protein
VKLYTVQVACIVGEAGKHRTYSRRLAFDVSAKSHDEAVNVLGDTLSDLVAWNKDLAKAAKEVGK